MAPARHIRGEDEVCSAGSVAQTCSRGSARAATVAPGRHRHQMVGRSVTRNSAIPLRAIRRDARVMTSGSQIRTGELATMTTNPPTDPPIPAMIAVVVGEASDPTVMMSRGDARSDWRGQQRGRSQAGQGSDAHGGYSQDDYGQSGVYDDDYASKEYGAPPPDPFDDPRAPRSLRSTPQRGPDAGSGNPPDDGRSRRPPTDPSRDRRRDESSYRGRSGYGPDGLMPPQVSRSV